MPTRPARGAVTGHQDVGLSRAHQLDVEGHHSAGGASQQRVDGVQTNGVSGVDVEPEPAEEQYESAYDHEGHVVGRQMVSRAVGVELADARTDHGGAGQRAMKPPTACTTPEPA